jgi:outer membrane protein assembly factor BamB
MHEATHRLSQSKPSCQLIQLQRYASTVCASDAKTGVSLWNSTLNHYVSSFPIASGGLIYVFASNAILLGLDHYSGEVVAQYSGISGQIMDQSYGMFPLRVGAYPSGS